MSASHPDHAVPTISREDYLKSMRGERGVLVRLALQSGGSIERAFVLLDTDDGTGYLTRAFAVGDLLAMHASGYNDTYAVDPQFHHISLTDFDPVVGIEVLNVRIDRNGKVSNA